MNNPTIAAAPQQVPCVICGMWERMPHAKRYTTPTTAQDTETALIIGFWLGRRTEVPRFCPKHGTFFEALDRQEAVRAEAEALARAAAPTDLQQGQIANIRARAEELLKRAGVAALPASPMTVPPGQFALGPGPLLNGQSTPPHLSQVPSPLPSELVVAPQFPNAEPPKEVTQPMPPGVCPACKKVNPGQGHVCDIQELKAALTKPNEGEVVIPPLAPQPVVENGGGGEGAIIVPVVQPSNVGTVQGALEAAQAPPTPGAAAVFPCMFCKKPVQTGETHVC